MSVLALILASMQLGAIAAVSALAAPGAFAALGAGGAGPYLRWLFPRYFATALVLAGVAAFAALAGGDAPAAGLLAVDAACFAVALALVPRINAARDRGDPAFGRLHGASVLANGLGLLLGIVAVVRLVLA